MSDVFMQNNRALSDVTPNWAQVRSICRYRTIAKAFLKPAVFRVGGISGNPNPVLK
jgi:hypothetical protein